MDDSIYIPLVPGCMVTAADDAGVAIDGAPSGSTGCLLLAAGDIVVMLTCSRVVAVGKAVQSNRSPATFVYTNAHFATVSALLTIDGDVEASQQHPDDVPLTSTAVAISDMVLFKRGAGTRLTTFSVVDTSVTHTYVDSRGYSHSVSGAVEVYSISVAFSPQDYGAVAHTADGAVVGMIYDVSTDGHTAWLTTIQAIMTAFSATFYVQSPVLPATVNSPQSVGHAMIASPTDKMTLPVGSISPLVSTTYEVFGKLGAFVSRLIAAGVVEAAARAYVLPAAPKEYECRLPDGTSGRKRTVAFEMTGVMTFADIPFYGFSGWLPTGATNDASWDGYGLKWEDCSVGGALSLVDRANANCTGADVTCLTNAYRGSAHIDPSTGVRTGDTQSATTATCTPTTYTWVDDTSAPYSVIAGADLTCTVDGTVTVLGTTKVTNAGCNNCISGQTAHGWTQASLRTAASPDMSLASYGPYDPPQAGLVAQLSVVEHTPASTSATLLRCRRSTVTLSISNACACGYANVFYIVVTEAATGHKAAAGFNVLIATDTYGAGSVDIDIDPPPFIGTRYICRVKIANRHDPLDPVPVARCAAGEYDKIICCVLRPYLFFPMGDNGEPSEIPAIRVAPGPVIQQVYYFGTPQAEDTAAAWALLGFYPEEFLANVDGVITPFSFLARIAPETPEGPLPCGIAERVDTLTSDGVTNVSRWLVYIPAESLFT